jgi:hypothetical protein
MMWIMARWQRWWVTGLATTEWMFRLSRMVRKTTRITRLYFFEACGDVTNAEKQTLAFTHSISVKGDQMSYEETTVLDIFDKIFDHTDQNTLKKTD